jgi:hypothetical protein
MGYYCLTSFDAQGNLKLMLDCQARFGVSAREMDAGRTVGKLPGGPCWSGCNPVRTDSGPRPLTRRDDSRSQGPFGSRSEGVESKYQSESVMFAFPIRNPDGVRTITRHGINKEFGQRGIR